VFSLFDQRTKNQAKRKKGAKVTAASKKSANNGLSKTGKKKNGDARDREGEQENDSNEEDDEEGAWCSYIVLYFSLLLYVCIVAYRRVVHWTICTFGVMTYMRDFFAFLLESLCLNSHVYLTFGADTNTLSH